MYNSVYAGDLVSTIYMAKSKYISGNISHITSMVELDS